MPDLNMALVRRRGEGGGGGGGGTVGVNDGIVVVVGVVT